ncbi:amidohydrolase [Peptoniphilus sp. KCTC 25270]|uniref:M20 metallopeptidase family protein n=1 Tax=Peptoniphilus sp. KCTC 25270 TaxID=2897414 RepID=UPI001E4F6CE3|nr:amidohydrolase [Peptoniphilus sp. KCTC 25270]MCD1147286.1 amidohydrolase [Peptoniphilus sp. KCTC 25270]
MTKIIDQDVLEIEEYLIQTRRHFHENPEASLKEYETSKFIKKELDTYQIPYVSVGETGVLATIEGAEKGKTIFLRADFDALELEEKKDVPYASKNKGLCHACGHDAHTAALLGAARILQNRKDHLKGTIKLCFQQAEEIGAGARQFVEAGHLKDVDAAFGIHVASNLSSGTVQLSSGPKSASCDIFKIHVHGNSSHAARPHLGNDAALATASILVGLQPLISRQKSPFEPAVISIGKIEAGSRYNVVAEEGLLEGTLRTLDSELRSDFLKQIEETAALIAKTHGCTAEFENYNAANVLVNQENATKYAQKIIAQRIGEEQLLTEDSPSLGSEDFADFTQIVDAAFLYVGTSKNEETSVPAHNGAFDIDESQLKLMTQIHVDLVENFHL